MKYTLKAYSIWEQGPREKQEDSMYPGHGELTDNDRLFILCDGMGGHSAGEIASGTVCMAMSNYILSLDSKSQDNFSDENFRDALDEAYDALDAKDDGAAKKMGTTLTFLKLHNGGCTIAHIGDSRVYHIRPGKGIEDTEILFQTEDHSLVNDLVKIGELTREEAKSSKQKNVITRAMQPCMERRSKADLYHSEDIRPGDYFMLCSDGILEQMEDDNIKYIFSAKGGDIVNKIDILTKATVHNRDNHSAILVNIADVGKVVAETDGSHVPELPIAQQTEPAAVQSKREGRRATNRMINNTICAMVGFALVFGGFYFYKNRQNEQTESGTTTVPPQVAPSNMVPKPAAPAQSKKNPVQEERDRDTEFENAVSTEETVSTEATVMQQELSPKDTTSKSATPSDALGDINDDDIPCSDEDKAKEIVQKNGKNSPDSSDASVVDRANRLILRDL